MGHRSFSIIYYFLVLISLLSCNDKNKINPMSSFTYEDLTDTYDSTTEVFTRDYDSHKVTIPLILTKKEKEKIRMAFSENNFQRLPGTIDCSIWGNHPKIYDRLSLNDTKVEYIHNVGESWFCYNGKKFSRINKTIQDIIFNKEEVKKLAPSQIAYE